MPAELYALMLLIIRAVAIKWIVYDVMRKQIILRRRPIKDKRAAEFREDMFKIAILFLIVNIPPTVIDVLGSLGVGQRPEFIPALSVVYTLTFSLGTLALTYMVKRVYRSSLDKEYEGEA